MGSCIKKPKKLSDIDWEVFRLLAVGKSAKEIHISLNIPAWKVLYSTERVFRYFNVHSRVELAHYALFYELVNNIYAPQAERSQGDSDAPCQEQRS